MTAREPAALDTAREPLIRAENLKKRYAVGAQEVWALRGVSLSVERGEFISILGPSGSGKTTLFQQLGALDRPSEGQVYFDGHAVFELDEAQRAWFRCHKIGYIFQTFNLLPALSSLENVALPLVFAGLAEVEARERARSVLDRVGLASRLEHKPLELSGGQQQRVAIARALVNRPDVVLADEPTGNLDSRTGAEIVALLRELNREHAVTVVCSTHDPKLFESSDRVLRLRDGAIESVTASEHT